MLWVIKRLYRWYVIAGIIFGSLTLLSLLWCIGACLCFGTRCCCGCCGVCGGSRRRRLNQRSRDGSGAATTGLSSSPPPVPTSRQGEAVMYQPAPPQVPVYRPPTTATPTSITPYNEDALPPMPTWDAAPTKKVLNDHHVSGGELGLRNLHPQSPLVSPGPTTGAIGGPRRQQPDLAFSSTSSQLQQQQYGYQHQYRHQRQPDYRSGGDHLSPGGEGREGGGGYGHGHGQAMHHHPDPSSSARRPGHPPFLTSTTPDRDDWYSSPPARYTPAVAPNMYGNTSSAGPPSYRS